jgi:hypothetical protein
LEISWSLIVVVITVSALVFIVVVVVVGTQVQRRKGYSGLGGDTIVRCSKGHLFTTIWLPGVSIKSVRLGMARYQHCPVGHHWAVVKPVNDAELTDEDRRVAAEHHDVRIP